MKSRGWGFFGFILCIELLLCTLGTWQIFRWEEKRALIQTSTLKSQSSPFQLQHLVDDLSLEFQPILLKGTFLHLHEKVLQPRTLDGKVGVHLVTPFQLADGRTILVDRGWSTVQALPLIKRPRHSIVLQGILYAVRPPGFFAPQNDPQKDLWYVLDPTNIFSPISFKQLYLISVKEAGWDANPRAPLPAFRNFHLQYALTWYALMVCIFMAYQVMKRQET